MAASVRVSLNGVFLIGLVLMFSGRMGLVALVVGLIMAVEKEEYIVCLWSVIEGRNYSFL